MDDHRFDDLARALANRLPRRRLLQRAAGVLGGALLAGRAARARAQACAQCLPAWQCCGTGHAIPCCAADGTCCDQICCNAGYACVGGFCQACEPEKRCGSACCTAEQTCENGQCVAACPAGATTCGDACCTAEQTCENGQCVAACPVGRTARRGVAAEAGCEPCQVGTVQCGGACVLECKPGRIMNVDTCACECEGQSCGTECCPAEQECTFHGDDERPPRCCLKGTSCGLYCKGDPRIRCCKTGPFPVSISCDARNQVCKGGACRRKRRRSRRK